MNGQKRLLLLVMLGFLNVALADRSSDYKAGYQVAQASQGTIESAMKQFQPNATLPYYTDHPDAAKYYASIDPNMDGVMQQDAMQKVTQDASSRTVINAFQTRPIDHINPGASEIQQGAFVIAHADHIARGISDKDLDCHQEKRCTPVNIEATCQESVRTTTKICKRSPHITIQNETHETDDPFYGDLARTGPKDFRFYAAESGVVRSVSLSLGHYGGKGPFMCNVPYTGTVNGRSVGTYGPIKCGLRMGSLQFSTSNLNLSVLKGQSLTLHVSLFVDASGVDYARYSMAIHAAHTTKKTNIDWVEVCHDV